MLDVYTDTLELRLVNKQGITLTYAPLYAPVVDLPGVDIRPGAPTVTIRPMCSALLPVQMTARPTPWAIRGRPTSTLSAIRVTGWTKRPGGWNCGRRGRSTTRCCRDHGRLRRRTTRTARPTLPTTRAPQRSPTQ
ncbi:MAG: hypothetical protein R3A10_18685 [Caldilineaceae bacterium]